MGREMTSGFERETPIRELEERLSKEPLSLALSVNGLQLADDLLLVCKLTLNRKEEASSGQ